MHMLVLLSEHCEEGLLLLLLLVRIDTVDCVSKLALLATRRTPGCASLCTRGENFSRLVACAVKRCFLVGFSLIGPACGRARGTIKTG